MYAPMEPTRGKWKPGFPSRMVPLAVLAALLIAGTLPGRQWQVNLKAANQVRFVSVADLVIKRFTFRGLTDQVDGYLNWPEDSTGGQFYFEVDLTSFRTGIEKRDQDMRRWVLETDRWPISWFRGRFTLHPPATPSDDSLAVRAAGTLFLHGVERPLQVEGSVQRRADTLEVQAHFPVALREFNIKVPTLLAAKVADTVQVQVHLYLEPMGK
ncbi:MAG: YceI family protein [Calditrichaeota bacterium]|nr:MAG: YceI family protein [Calditrichota bacterium]